jgi:glycosyltransferase involved in cell wall biosynthesis
MRTSGAVQVRDLACDLVRKGYDLTVLLPSSGQVKPWVFEELGGLKVLRLRVPHIDTRGYLRRTIHELMMPFAMIHNFRKSPLGMVRWDGIIWYSPSIFFGPLVRSLRTLGNCRRYLIIRDIFPEWALDVGLIGKGLPYLFFRLVARYQYQLADVIGVQSPGNLAYFPLKGAHRQQLEVLENWLGPVSYRRCALRVDTTKLAGRRILVYAGNMGVAQNLDLLFDLALSVRDDATIGFLFVGRGGERDRLKRTCEESHLENVLFHDEIGLDEIFDLYEQCDIGLVSLDLRHRSHNIPGKFVAYMQAGLPVLATVNPGNDLSKLIRDEKVGRVIEENALGLLVNEMYQLLQELTDDQLLSDRCKTLFQKRYSAERAGIQIIKALNI